MGHIHQDVEITAESVRSVSMFVDLSSGRLVAKRGYAVRLGGIR